MLYRESFTAGQTKSFAISGNFFRLKRVTGVESESVDVVFQRDGQRVDHDLTDADAGDGIGPLPQGAGFDFFEITSAVAQDVYFDVARGQRFSQRVVGEVLVVDGEKAVTLAGQGRFGQLGINAVPAEYSNIQLLNPAGSGVRAVIETIRSSSSAAANMVARRYDVPLTTLVYNWPNALIAGAAGSCEMRRQNGSSSLGVGSFLIGERLQADTGAPPFVLRKPLVLEAGEGLVISLETVNVFLNAMFQGYEESV